MIRQKVLCPCQVAQLVGALSLTPKGCGFDPQSGYTSRLWVLALVRVHMRGNQSMFHSHIDLSLSLSLSLCFSLSLSLPCSLKKIKKRIKLSSGED